MEINEIKLTEENAILKAEIERLKRENATLSLQTKEFDEYDVVAGQIGNSKIARINWVAIFGETLTKIVAEYYAKHYNPVETYEDIKKKMADMSITNPELLRRLKIGICARFGEIRSENKRIKEVEYSAKLPLWKKVGDNDGNKDKR